MYLHHRLDSNNGKPQDRPKTSHMQGCAPFAHAARKGFTYRNIFTGTLASFKLKGIFEIARSGGTRAND